MVEAAEKRKEQVKNFRKGLKELARSRPANSSEDTKVQKDMRKKKMKELLGFPFIDGNNEMCKKPADAERSRLLKLKLKMLEEEKSGIRPAWERIYREIMLRKEMETAKNVGKENEVEEINLDEYLDELPDVQEMEQV